MKISIKNNKGFTLIELIVVIAVLSVLAAIIIPTVVSNVERANESADMAHTRQLNLATQLYYHGEKILWPALLNDFPNDVARQNHLVSFGYLNSVIEARSNQYEILWNNTLKLWYYSKFELAVSKQVQTFIFSDLRGTTLKTGVDGRNESKSNWALTENGLVGSQGNVFLDNANEAYTIEATGRMNTSNSGNGGFGIFVETSVSSSGGINKDTGYIVQFDRGYNGGEIVVRRRIDGVELSNRITNSSIGVKNKNTNPEWWTQNQDLKVEVSAHPTDVTKKYLTVYVNGVKSINNFVIDANENPNQNFTGVRGWTQPATIENITITPQD